MSLLAQIAHKTALLAHQGSHRRFRRALERPRETQEAILLKAMKRLGSTEAGQAVLHGREIRGYPGFAETFPVTDYPDWSDWINRQKVRPEAAILAPGCARFEPTSGSTEARKWIPYSKALLREFDGAASAWLKDLSRAYPQAFKGKHYWSLSWLPNELRDQSTPNSNDDVQIFPTWKRWIVSQVMAVPSQTSGLPTLEESLTATLAYLAASAELSLISVWSPTFALELFKDLAAQRLTIAAILESGQWQIGELKAPRSVKAARLLRAWSGELSPDFFSKLWPKLALISCWDSSNSAHWAGLLRELFPGVPLQGKGLWATEGVVTIPFEDRLPAALTSHFLEFRCLSTQKIQPLWALEDGARVQPILTTGSGLVRYQLHDELEVCGFLKRTPCFRFLGRRGSVDLVGEKIDQAAASELLARLTKESGVHCISLLARIREAPERPRYIVLVEGQNAGTSGLGARAEAQLLTFHHYRLARELGQLAPAEALGVTGAVEFYHELSGATAVAGSRKIEPLTLWKLS